MKYILIAYFLSNIFAKNCRNRTMYVKIIASQRWDVFLRHSVVVVVVRPRERLQSIVMSMSVCVSSLVCLSVCPTGYLQNPTAHMRSLPNFLCMLSVSVARFSYGMLTIGHIAYRRERVFFPIENTLHNIACGLSAGKGGWECTAWATYAIYDFLFQLFVMCCDAVDAR